MKGRKTAVLLAAVLLTAGIGMSVHAQESETMTEMPGSQTIRVTGSYSGDGRLLDTYSVDIEWGEMNFTYVAQGDRRWDAKTHTYSISSSDGWQADGNTVKVTNHSNLPVNVAFSFEKGTVNGTYTGAMSVLTKTLKAGIENKPTEADSVESELTLDGTLDALQTSKTELGAIKVSLTAVTDGQ